MFKIELVISGKVMAFDEATSDDRAVLRAAELCDRFAPSDGREIVVQGPDGVVTRWMAERGRWREVTPGPD
jgi:hypothetical protein